MTKKATAMQLNYLTVSIFFLGGLLLFKCGSKESSNKKEAAVQVATTVNVDYELAEDKSSLAEYYKLDHIKEWYPERILPPVFDFNVALESKSIVGLSLIRNEIFARNGYLFEDAVLRGHFNQFKWYQPIFDVPEFKVQLNNQEQEFVNKVLKRESELFKERYHKQGDYDMISMDHVYNLIQFKAIDANLVSSLTKNNFAIVPAKHEQFFHVYDNNHYQYIPNFITTDIYLQVLHKHFGSILQKVEQDKFIPLLTRLLEDLHKQSTELQQNAGDEMLKRAARWSTTYLAIGHNLITGKPGGDVSDQMFKTEMEKILASKGTGSDFLKSDIIQYSQFKPRGSYTKSTELENYFRCVKWLNTAPILIQDDERFLSAVLIASFIKKSPENLKAFQRFNEAIKLIVGEEDNLSISNLLSILTEHEANDPSKLLRPGSLRQLREKLSMLGVDRIKPKGGDALTSKKVEQVSILFTAGRYTFDAEILSRLVHALRPEPKRPFPKGLDIFASFGNDHAKNILLEEYQEDKKWPAFPDSLKVVQEKFSMYSNWNTNIYTKTFEAIINLDAKNQNAPHFMQTPSWRKKNLNTSLAAWTELKHDMLLYAEQPYAAQAGEGGGPPPPQHISYVEPNIVFWEKALELLTFQEESLAEMDLLHEDTKRNIDELKEIGNVLLAVSKKEMTNENITPDEFDKLSWLGGQIEYLTFRIFDSDHLPEKERFVALVADVYNYNGTYLEEAVGMVDEIYVVAEINGKPYLTKGSVFSYFEFNSDEPLSDEEWREQLISGREPDRPAWMKPIITKTKPLESKPSYSF